MAWLSNFTDGGVWMYIILALDVLLPPIVLIVLVLAITSRLTNKLRTLALVMSLVVTVGTAMPVCTGLVGWQVGANATYSAVQAAPSEMKHQLDRSGREIAGYPLSFGCCSTTALAAPMLLALLLTMRKRKRWEEVTDDD